MAWRNAKWTRLAAALAATAAAVIAPSSSGPASADRGDLDVTFAGSGQVRVGVPSTPEGAPGAAVAADPATGRVYVAAIEPDAGGDQVYVAAYTSAGALDPGFGVGGVARTGVEASAMAGVDVALSPDGQRVYLTTYAAGGDFAGQSYVAALRADDGSLDATFGDGGRAPTGRLGALAGAHSLAVDATTGRVYMATTEVADPADIGGLQYIAAFTPDGDLDPTFGDGGLLDGATGYVRGELGLAVDPATSRLYVVLSFGPLPAASWGVLLALQPDGYPDPTFGEFDPMFGDGALRLPLLTVGAGRWALALSPAGDRVYVASYEAVEIGRSNPFVIAVTAAGEVDPTFGTDGVARTVHEGHPESGHSLAVDPGDGTVFLATYGEEAGVGEVHVAAFTTAGSLDPSFGTDGIARTGVDATFDTDEHPGSGIGIGSALDPSAGRLYVTNWADPGTVGPLLSAFELPADPILSIDDVTLAEGTGTDPTVFTFTVSLDTPARSEVSFDIATADATADDASDYVPISLTGQTIAAGASTYTLDVLVTADALPEPDERFFVNVTNLRGARMGDAVGDGVILDDDTPEVLISPATGLSTTEAGGTATFTVSLSHEPIDPVTVELASSDTTEGTVTPASLTFDGSNWNVPQNATVTGVDDAIVDGDIAYLILTSVDTTDSLYGGLDPVDVAVTNTDDDVAGITVTPPVGLRVSENGGVASLSLVLASQPLSDVVITLASSEPAEALVAPQTLTFTPDDWASPQVAAVTGVDDAVVDGPGEFTISITVGSGDPTYDGLSVPPVPGVNEDDDVAPPTTPAPTTPAPTPPPTTPTSPPPTSPSSTTPDPTAPSPTPPGPTPPGPTPPPTAPTLPGPIPSLPATGGSPFGTIALGAGLVAIGAAALLGARARARRAV